jgi:N-acetylneuraminic acid mutarotase
MISWAANTEAGNQSYKLGGAEPHSPGPKAPAWLVIACFMFFTPATPAAETKLTWSPLAPLPEKLGVAGAFAGVSGGALLVAGGANFPDQMPWQGGRKVWHDSVFVLETPTGPWKKAGQLPHPLGYGVSVSHKHAVICVGGSDATRHYADAFQLRWRSGALAIEPLPALPMPLANMSGALAGQVLYIAGGTEAPGEQCATNRFFALNLSARQPAWSELPPVPGPPRLLAAAAAHNDAFYLFGGATLAPNAEGKVVRAYLRESWRFRPGPGWERLDDLPRPCVAAPSPAPFVAGKFLLLAGDDGSRAGFSPVKKHPGFANGILAYAPASGRWSAGGEVPAPRATAPCVEWRGRWVVPSGELRPGVRSPEVWSLKAR